MSQTLSTAHNPPRCLPPPRPAGRTTIDGLEILVAQGALSLELWTGRERSARVMRRAAATARRLNAPRALSAARPRG